MADDQQQPQPDAAPEQPPKAPPMGKAPPKAKARAPRGPRVPKAKAAKAKPKAKQGPLLRQGEISFFIYLIVVIRVGSHMIYQALYHSPRNSNRSSPSAKTDVVV